MTARSFFAKLNEVDAIIVFDEVNTFYLSGYSNTFAYYVITKNEAYYLTDDRYIEEASNTIKDELTFISVSPLTLYAKIVEILKSCNVKTVGYEDNRIKLIDYVELKENLVDFMLVPVGKKIDEIKAIKSKEEIAKIKKACDINTIAFNKMLELVKEGVTEKDLALELEYQMLKNGASGIAFDTICAFGEDTSKPHAHVSNRKLKRGDMITLDFGAKYDGYCSDITRTFAFGNIDKEQENIYNIVLEANLLGLSVVKSGMNGYEVDKIVRDFIMTKGYGEKFTHGLGHSVGIEIHENPRLSKTCFDILKDGMIMTVEPGIYIEGKYGVRIEDSVVITSDKPEILTGIDKKLLII